MPFYEDTIYRQYFAVSKWGNLCNVLGLVLVTILPFIVTFAIGTLWSKEDSFRMQPTVFWPKKALLVVWNAQADQQQPQAFVWTSMAKVAGQRVPGRKFMEVQGRVFRISPMMRAACCHGEWTPKSNHSVSVPLSMFFSPGTGDNNSNGCMSCSVDSASTLNQFATARS